MLAHTKPSIEQLIAQLETELAGQHLIDTPMPHERELVVLIPVRAERVDRLLKLLGSLALQDIDLRKLEVILLVNNRPDDGTPDWRQAYELNQTLLAQPLYRNRQGDTAGIFSNRRAMTLQHKLDIFAIDQSSPDNWVKNGNVGMARQRGLAEAVLRFAQLGRNGLVMHTDADCWLDDASFIQKLLWIFNEYPDIMAFGGHYTLELDVRDPEAEGLIELLPNYKRYHCYLAMFKDIRRGYVGRTEILNTVGRCIVHRAFEGIEVGGIRPESIYEDYFFTEAFKENGMRFEQGFRWDVGVMSAFRISDRTPSSIRNDLVRIGGSGNLIVEDAFNEGRTIVLDDVYMHHLVDAVRIMPNGPERLKYIFLSQPAMRTRVTGI